MSGYDKLFDICTACYTCTHVVHWSISPLSSSVCSALSAEREDHRRLQPRSTLLLIILDDTRERKTLQLIYKLVPRL